MKPDYSERSMLSAEMSQVYAMVEVVSKTDAPVMLRSEVGADKEHIALLIHSSGTRAKMPFLKFSFSNLSSQLLEAELFGLKNSRWDKDEQSNLGLVESSNHGTLFLDCIEKMPAYLQLKFLRLLKGEEYLKVPGGKKVAADVRLITATSQILENDVRAGRFNEELYYRLNVVAIAIPKLTYRADISDHLKLPEAVETLEKEMITNALRKSKGVQRRACEILGITMRMLGYKLTQYQLREHMTDLPQMRSRKIGRDSRA